jgi:hypothetical protein
MMPWLILVAEERDTSSVIVWSVVLVGFLVVMFVGVTYLRKWVTRGESSPIGGFSLAELRQLHKAGQMTDEEFERAKAKIVAAAQKAHNRPSTKPPPPEFNSPR